MSCNFLFRYFGKNRNNVKVTYLDVNINPTKHKHIICRQVTSAYKAFSESENVNAVFAPYGIGRLLSGHFISTKGLFPKTKVIGVAPNK